MRNWIEFCQDNNITIVGTSDKAHDEKGYPFATITSGGRKEQGEHLPVLYSSADRAWRAYEDALLTWLEGRRRVYVRLAPIMQEQAFYYTSLYDDPTPIRYYSVYSRLTAH